MQYYIINSNIYRLNVIKESINNTKSRYNPIKSIVNIKYTE